MYSMPMAGPEGWEGSSTRPHPLGLDRTCRGYDGFGSSARITKATTHLGPPTSQPNPRPSKTKDVGFHRPTNREKNAHTHTHTHTHTHNNNNARQRQTKPPHPTTNRHITGSRHRPHDHPAPPERRLQLNLPHEALSATE
jgi:hypothetical protein